MPLCATLRECMTMAFRLHLLPITYFIQLWWMNAALLCLRLFVCLAAIQCVLHECLYMRWRLAVAVVIIILIIMWTRMHWETVLEVLYGVCLVPMALFAHFILSVFHLAFVRDNWWKFFNCTQHGSPRVLFALCLFARSLARSLVCSPTRFSTHSSYTFRRKSASSFW